MESDGTAARGRVRETDLPAGLTHGVSREFLVAEGLPETAAFLDFARPGAGLLEAPAWPDGRQRGRTGPLFVLGETQYCGSRVVLDGVTGEVHLAAWVDGKVRRDLLASDLPALAGLIRATEAVARDAGQREAGDGHRGAAAAAARAGIVERRMREVDPGLFGRTAQNPPAHWGTALLVASLAWGARPGTEAGGLAGGSRLRVRRRPGRGDRRADRRGAGAALPTGGAAGRALPRADQAAPHGGGAAAGQ
ncbi:SUKH-4 family immunity protein [Streptomyces sp900116325]|uniref:SUKH-4 family immunity protein n=1 Tax=Streptomyces sp. 900116325 TaxID=3154295 RepID=UPI0033BB8D7D